MLRTFFVKNSAIYLSSFIHLAEYSTPSFLRLFIHRVQLHLHTRERPEGNLTWRLN
jgi:hypothetical protein